MSKLIDITEKLNFEGKPHLKIKDQTIEVNNSATAGLKVVALLEEAKEKITVGVILQLYNLIFDAGSRKKIDSLELSMDDLATVVLEGTNILMKTGGTAGEATTPATT